MVTFACLGHWYVQLLFAVPSVGTIGFMGRDSMRKRRKSAQRRGQLASPQGGEALRETRETVNH